MAYNKNNYVRIKEEFSQKHRDKVNAADERKFLLESKYPELAEIDAALRLTAMKIYGALFVNERESLDKIKEENEKYQIKQKSFLKEHGYSEDYLLPHYDCPICEDRGTVGFNMCSCMKKALIMAGYESSGMGNLINNCSFENFDLSHFKSNDTLYENMKTVYSICKSYTREFTTDSALVCGGSPNLIMTGATGLGKTHLSAAIAKGLIDRGYDVVYDTALDIFSNFESERFGTERYNENKKSGLYFDCDVLIIDDLGTELTNQFTTMILFNLINTRLNRKKAMIINTNLSLKELRGRYADRITSRILGEFRPLQFCGTDYRSIKLRS